MRNSAEPKLCQFEVKRWLAVMGLVAATHLLCQSLTLPYGKALRSLLTVDQNILEEKENKFQLNDSSKKLADVNFGVETPYAAGTPTSTEQDMGRIEFEKGNTILGAVIDTDDQNATDIEDEGVKEILEFVGEGESDDDSNVDGSLNADKTSLETLKQLENETVLEMAGKIRHGLSIEQIIRRDGNISADTNPKEHKTESLGEGHKENAMLPSPRDSISHSENLVSNANTSLADQVSLPSDITSMESDLTTLRKNPIGKKMRCNTPPKSVTLIDEMNRIFRRNRRASRSMKPQWSSVRDKEILAAREQIENAPPMRGDREPYAPLFRNISTFKRSYELMERVLKVYVYKDGKRPIFHQPIMKGLYASEGWFMKLMENNKQFLVKDPKKAHLFYMPFSSRMLEYTLYVRNSHNRTNLRQHLKEYTEIIASKYPFWNRTGGSDHFLVACHDWAPYETRHHMERCIKALCNADVTGGFKIGRDVSLPETYVRSQRNPQRDLGGKPASQRYILAFYAGSLHGYLRPILLQYWKDKDPSMKIFGRMPAGVASKMNYIQYMKSSKYCICPKGYEVNSPRVVEAIVYECVPVIISDNFVPPLFDVLNWEAFSVIIPEKDIPNLKDILLSIPESKYLDLQLAVRRAQPHFLWHGKPVKYDLFHMVLHSIWNNRVFQIKI
ncbi:unnamed protein product [Rhodiola kirilowii]